MDSERQAFGRVLRIGQEKETYFARIIIKDTVDAGIIERMYLLPY